MTLSLIRIAIIRNHQKYLAKIKIPYIWRPMTPIRTKKGEPILLVLITIFFTKILKSALI